MKKIAPFLWFNNNAEEAVELYLSIFKDGKRLDTVRAGDDGPRPKGAVITIPFEIAGRTATPRS